MNAQQVFEALLPYLRPHVKEDVEDYVTHETSPDFRIEMSMKWTPEYIEAIEYGDQVIGIYTDATYYRFNANETFPNGIHIKKLTHIDTINVIADNE